MKTFEVGQELAAKSVVINRAALVAYADASGDHNPIHQDEAFAKSVGLENVIAHGMFTMALAGRYLSEIAGSGAVKEFGARFTKPVVVPADVDVELIVSAKVTEVVTEVGNELLKLEITAMCNEIKVLGMAKATIVLS